MSEITELAQSTIQKVMERVDLLAGKLGIAAGQVWKFTVTARQVNARREMAKFAALMLVPLVFWGWAMHVALMPIPHDVEKSQSYVQEFSAQPCDQVAMVNGKQEVIHTVCQVGTQKPTEQSRDKGLADVGIVLIISGVLLALAGLLIAGIGIAGIIDAIAATRTAEYDSYQDLIYDWKD